MRKMDIFKECPSCRILLITSFDIELFERLYRKRLGDEIREDLETYLVKDYNNCVLIYKDENENFVFEKSKISYIWKFLLVIPIIPVKILFYDVNYLIEDYKNLYKYFGNLYDVFRKSVLTYASILREKYLKKIQKYPYHFNGKKYYLKFNGIDWVDFHLKVSVFDENGVLLGENKFYYKDDLKYLHDFKMYLNDKIHKILFDIENKDW